MTPLSSQLLPLLLELEKQSTAAATLEDQYTYQLLATSLALAGWIGSSLDHWDLGPSTFSIAIDASLTMRSDIDCNLFMYSLTPSGTLPPENNSSHSHPPLKSKASETTPHPIHPSAPNDRCEDLFGNFCSNPNFMSSSQRSQTMNSVTHPQGASDVLTSKKDSAIRPKYENFSSYDFEMEELDCTQVDEDFVLQQLLLQATVSPPPIRPALTVSIAGEGDNRPNAIENCGIFAEFGEAPVEITAQPHDLDQKQSEPHCQRIPLVSEADLTAAAEDARSQGLPEAGLHHPAADTRGASPPPALSPPRLVITQSSVGQDSPAPHKTGDPRASQSHSSSQVGDLSPPKLILSPTQEVHSSSFHLEPPRLVMSQTQSPLQSQHLPAEKSDTWVENVRLPSSESNDSQAALPKVTEISGQDSEDTVLLHDYMPQQPHPYEPGGTASEGAGDTLADCSAHRDEVGLAFETAEPIESVSKSDVNSDPALPQTGEATKDAESQRKGLDCHGGSKLSRPSCTDQAISGVVKGLEADSESTAVLEDASELVTKSSKPHSSPMKESPNHKNAHFGIPPVENSPSSSFLPNTQTAVLSLVAMAGEKPSLTATSLSCWGNLAATKLDLGSSQETEAPRSDTLQRYRRRVSKGKSLHINNKSPGDKSVFEFPVSSEPPTNVLTEKNVETRLNEAYKSADRRVITSPPKVVKSKDSLQDLNALKDQRKSKRVVLEEEEEWNSQEALQNISKRPKASEPAPQSKPKGAKASDDRSIEVDEYDVPVSWKACDLPTLKFAVLWAHLEEAGWSWSKGQKLISYYWKRPNADIRTGTEVSRSYHRLWVLFSFNLGR